MKKLMLLGASVLLLSTFTPQEADAQRRGYGYGRAGPRGVVVAPRYRGGYAYRRGRGWGPAVGLGVLGGAALGAAAAGAYGYTDPCLRQQQVYDLYGNVVWQTVRVC
jgi:hypothetical protein